MIQKEEQKKELLKNAEISLILDTYDDIFSDFDPRPFSQRALSDDFLLEAKKASRELKQGIEIRFMMPHDKRDLQVETVIKKRLKEHFKKHSSEFAKDVEKIKNKGRYFCLAGIVIMFLAAFILFQFKESSMITHFLVVLLEPAGWFLFWEGLDLVIFESKKKIPDLEFYEKMNSCEISFISY